MDSQLYRKDDTNKEEEEMNEEEVREAFVLLDLIAAEFKSDPMSVQCFDLRIVERTKLLTDKWNAEGRP